jgi:AraC family transcriptional regulator
MARDIHRLTQRRVRDIVERGRHADGGGLYLQVSPTLAKSWIFRFTRHGRSHELGLGSVKTVTLAEARAQARAYRKLLRQGLDPAALRHGRPAAATARGGSPAPAAPAAAPSRATVSESAPVAGRTVQTEGHLATRWLDLTVRRITLDGVQEATFLSPFCCISVEVGGAHAPGDILAHWDCTPAGTATPVGDCTFIPAGRAVHFRSTRARSRKITCLFDPARFDAFRDWEWSAADLALCLDLKQPRLQMALRFLASEALAPGFGSEVLAEAVTLGLMVQLAREFRDARARGPAAGAKLADHQVALLRDMVEAAAGAGPSLADLAAACAVSPRHLSRLFRNTTGTTISAFVAEARIRRAKRLLACPDRMIKVVAHDCGFRNAAAFAAAFRRATGRTPRQYRAETLSAWP